MRILIVANHNPGHFVPFVVEQAEALKRLGMEVDYFGVHGKGIRGYLSNRSALVAKVKEFRPDIIHGHYGLSGLLANLQRRVPVVTTYHGSDIHSGGRTLLFSRISIRLSACNIFVSPDLQVMAAHSGKRSCVLPCGVDTLVIRSMERSEARKLLGWDADGKYVLFAGAFNREVKNPQLAQAAMALVPEARLMEMRGYSREQLNLAMNAANCLLMTSHREGSPQVVKEALTCGTPIVSVKVGDVAEVTAGVDGCYITKYDAQDIAHALRQAMEHSGKTNGYERIVSLGLSNELIAKKLVAIYEDVVNKK